MAPVHLQYWAGARAAAGTAGETVEAESVRRALEIVCAAHPDPAFRRVIRACSLLIDGVAAHEPDLDRVLAGPVRVELLPPFAGGAVAAEARVVDGVDARGCAPDHVRCLDIRT